EYQQPDDSGQSGSPTVGVAPVRPAFAVANSSVDPYIEEGRAGATPTEFPIRAGPIYPTGVASPSPGSSGSGSGSGSEPPPPSSAGGFGSTSIGGSGSGSAGFFSSGGFTSSPLLS